MTGYWKATNGPYDIEYVDLRRIPEAPASLIEESTHMNRKSFLVNLLAAGFFLATSMLMTSPGNAQADPKVAKAMAILKAETAKLGAPKAEGTDQTADKTTPACILAQPR